MSATKGFKVGDVVKMSAAGKKEFTNTEYNPFHLTGIIESKRSSSRMNINVTWSNGEKNSYDPEDLELVKPKQEQYYTSIPKDVKVGDKFEVISEKGYSSTNWVQCNNLKLGDVVTFNYTIESDEPAFIKPDGRTGYLNWGCLKPVKENVATAHLADVPPSFLFGRDSLTPNEMCKFNIGDEVELIEDYDEHKKGTKGIVLLTDEKGTTFLTEKKKSVYCYNHRLKLINNNKTTNNNAKSNSTSNDLRTAFSPDIRSKEIYAGQVFSEFNLPQIWSGH